MSGSCFTIEEIQELESTFLKKEAQTNKTWIKAFAYYNEKMRSGSVPLGMGCKPCYYKVLCYIKTGDIIYEITNPLNIGIK